MDGWIIVNSPPRGGGNQPEQTLSLQSFNGTHAWGSHPSTFTMVYIGAVPVTRGSFITATIGPHKFHGLCQVDAEVLSSQGNTRTLQMSDLREILNWDDVFGAFNMPDVRIVNGQRAKRWWHIFPADFEVNRKTYTDAPLTAREICDLLFNAPTVMTTWRAIYHADMSTYPVFSLDMMSGRKLAAALQEVSDRLGLLFTVTQTPWELLWKRKGQSLYLPGFPANSDQRRMGSALSGNPSAIRVVGDRNVYQVMNVPMTADWSAAWERFLVFEEFANDIYERGTDPQSGVRFNAVPGDPEHYVGRQLALARALEITLSEYVDLRNAEAAGSGDTYADHRKFHGRSRMFMPAALYIRVLLFRAFRPQPGSFVNYYGLEVPLDTVELVDRLLTDVWHDPVTGVMSWDPSIPMDGNGYAIVHGYQVGEDLFRTLRPDQFRVDMFANTRKVWQHAPYQIDDSGEGTRFILFDEPVIVSDDLFVEVDRQVCVNARFTLRVPSVKAALVFESERFMELFGTGDRFNVENVQGLYREAVVDDTEATEVLFADGQTATQKGADIAASLLLRQFEYHEGGYVVQGINGTFLTDMIDRVTVVFGPQGYHETVDWTSERKRDSFVPEREFDRALRTQHLLPGQEELRREANLARLTASALRQNPQLRRSLSDLVAGRTGPHQPLRVVQVDVRTVTGGTTLPVGSILRKQPTNITGATNTNTLAVLPGNANAGHKVFCGVTVRHNEALTGGKNGSTLRAQDVGEILARVKGPVAALDNVGLSEGAGTDDGNYLIKESGVPVGQVLQEVPADVVRLVPVRVGVGGAATGGDARWS
jgi:hypothetical protein